MRQLDEEGIKEKRKQRLIKAGYEARMRAKQEKQREKEAREEEERKEAEDRERNPRGWAEKLRREYEVCPFANAIFHRLTGLCYAQTTIDSMKDRKRRKAALSDRKSAAAQQRMANIASLASDAPQPKRKRKGGHGMCAMQTR